MNLKIMRTEDLKNFIAISNYGSLNKAASALNISQQGLSRSIKSLEESIGAKLFVRSSKGVELTSYGREFMHYASNVVFELDKLQEYVDNNRQSKMESIKIGLRISANASPMSSAINNTVEDYSLLNKDLSIIIHSAPQDVLLEELKSGEVDVVQVIGPVDEKQFDVYPIFRYKLCVMASKDFKMHGEDSVSINEIKDLPMVLPAKDNPLCKLIIKLFEEVGVEPNVANYEASAKTLTHLVHRKNGIGFMPENSASVVASMYPDVRIYDLLPRTDFCYSVVVDKGGRTDSIIRDLIIYLQENAENNIIPDSI